MYLKDKIVKEDSQGNGQYHSGHKNKVNEICHHYNKGKCLNGDSCKYLHKCEECGKFGHGVHICHKRKNSSNASSANAQNGSK